MDSCFIMSVTGPFTPDIINQLAHHNRKHGARWDTSKLICLDNHFAALMQVSIVSRDEAKLTSSLLEAFPQLQFNINACAGVNQTALEERPLTLSAPMEFELDCADRAGLTHDIHRVLETLRIHVDHFESYRVPVAMLGRNVYRAKLVLRLPETQSSQSVVNELEALEAGARANVKMSL